MIAQIGDLFGAENSLGDYSQNLFGIVGVFFPFLLMIIGLNLTKLKHNIAQPRIMWGFFLLILGLLVTFGSISENLAGYTGTQIAKVLAQNITYLGSFACGFTLVLISILITFNTNLHEVYEWTYPLLNGVYQGLRSIKNKFIRAHPENESETDHEITISHANQVEEKGEPIEDTSPPNEPQIEIIDEKTAPSAATTPPSDLEGGISTDQPIKHIPYTPPPTTILAEKEKTVTDQSVIEKSARIIEATLSNFGIQARIAEVNLGPAVTQYAINLAEGTRSSKITSLQNDIALALASPTGSVRIEAPIPGKRLIGIEVPNENLSIVGLKSILTSPIMKNDQSPLAVALGEDVSGSPIITHINKWPHIIIAGATGSGKSVLIHAIINSILFRASPEQVNFILIDPKRVELTQYNNIPHLRTPVIVEVDKTVSAFKWAVNEMEKRYRLFQQTSARNLADFNENTDTEKLPYVIIIVDELADLMVFAANEMETLITRIAQKARATGIHMVLSTQRPSVDVITGLIKANIPTRIALNVSSSTDSRVILDTIGAEKLLGKGDMLYLPPDAGKPKRIQGVFLSNREIAGITEYMNQFIPIYQLADADATPQEESVHSGIDLETFSDTATEPSDDKFYNAVQVILNHDKASASLLQRRLKIGYARAARLLDELEEKGLISPPDGSNPREVYNEAAKAFLENSSQSQSELM